MFRKDNKFQHKSFSQIHAFSKIFYIFVMAYGFCRWAVHIWLDIFDDSSELKNLAVLTCEENGNKIST